MSKVKQKYRLGDLVEVVHLCSMMSHFDRGVAIV